MGAAVKKSNNSPESGREPPKSAAEVIRPLASNPVEQPNGSNNPAGDLVARARHELGAAYGLARPLRKTELARLIGLEPGRHGGDFVGRLEKGTATLSGPLQVVLRMLLDGHSSPRHAEALASRYGRRPAGCKNRGRA